jgi:hypothetical protein
MQNHYIHYIKREIIHNTPNDPESPYFAELQEYDSGFDSPKFHATRVKSWPVNEIQEDDVIWLVGQLSAKWGRLAPSLDGKVIVGSIEEINVEGRKVKTRFTAKDGSMWFPLADASSVLSSMDIALKNGRIKRLYSKQRNNLGQAFQSIKKIHNPSILTDWADEVLSRDMEFISYRIADGTRGAFERAEKQIGLGGAVFWDRWSLPRRLAERRELVSDQALDVFLRSKIRSSTVVWGIESKGYSEIGSYSQKEKVLALSLNKYKSSTTE